MIFRLEGEGADAEGISRRVVEGGAIGGARVHAVLDDVAREVEFEGGEISGTSSVVQLDAWNWEDAAYKYDNGIHLNMPSFIQRFGRRGGGIPAGIPAALLARFGGGGDAGACDEACCQ